MTAPNDKVAYRFVDAALRFALRRLPNSSVTRKAALSWGYQYRPRPRTVRLRSGAPHAEATADANSSSASWPRASAYRWNADQVPM